MRAFVAIGLSEPVERLLAGIRDAVVDADPSWRGEKWVACENLHLTLRFLGDVPAEDSPALLDALAEPLRALRPFPLEVVGVRAVPSRKRATMIWATFDDREGGAQPLAEAVLGATAPWMAEESRRPFAAHATLVRARKPRGISSDALACAEAAIAGGRANGAASMSVRDVMLVASTLTPGGPVYETVGSVPLKGD